MLVISLIHVLLLTGHFQNIFPESFKWASGPSHRILDMVLPWNFFLPCFISSLVSSEEISMPGLRKLIHMYLLT